MTLGRMTSAALLMAAMACTTDRAPGAPLPKVRMSSNPHLSWGPMMIAQAEGFFREEGVDVEFVPALQIEETLVALITGDLDVRPGAVHAAFFSAISQGALVKIVAGSGVLEPQNCSYFAIVLRPGLDTLGAPDIGRIRTSQDGSTRYVVSRMLESRGRSLDRMETTRIENPVLAMSLMNGSLDAAAVTEPSLTRVAKSGTLWLTAEDVVPGYQWGVVAFSDRLLRRDRDVGLRFLRAYHRGVTQYRQGKTDRNVEILARETGETPEHVRQACWPVFREDSRVNWESLDAFQRWAKSERFMERTVSQDASFDSTLLADAVPRRP
jgi:NitT/TauT family transport system substrate-binding protein